MKYGHRVPLKTHRILGGYTQEAFAKELGVDRATVSLWETGKHQPRGDSVARIETLLGIKWADDVLMPEV